MHRRHAGAIGRRRQRLVHEALFVRCVQELRPLARHFNGCTTGHQFFHPAFHLLGFARFALDADQRGFQRIFRSAFVAALATLVEIHRRLLQRKQCCRHLFRRGTRAKIFLRQLGKRKFLAPFRALPQQRHVNVGQLRLRVRHERCRIGLRKIHQNAGRFDFDTTTSGQFHLSGGLSYRHDQSGLDLAVVFKKQIHCGVLVMPCGT